jgi:hypothetical protein
MQRTVGTRILRCRAILLFTLALIVQTADVNAAARIVGVVVDYAPHNHVSERLLISIFRNGQSLPVREHEILYEGDRLTFSGAAGPKAYVIALVDAEKKITLDSAHSKLPEPEGSFLQSIVPKLLAAYRWVNAAAGVDKAEPRNALSRGADDEVEELTIFPRARETLTISEASKDPLWIGWKGGSPPFTVSVAQDGKILQEIEVCKNGSEAGCSREATLSAVATAPGPLTLFFRSSDGASWSRQVKKAAIASDKEFATPDQVGSLGVFLGATELLDRDANAYVLESARRLATISSVYPPARTLLDNLKSGRVP